MFQSSSFSTIQINGKTFSGNSVQMSNGRIIIDGKDVTDQNEDVDLDKVLTIKVIDGTLGNLHTDKNVVCGDVEGDITATGIVTAGDVGGSVETRGMVNCNDVEGNVDAGGMVNAGDVGGNVRAGGMVNHG